MSTKKFYLETYGCQMNEYDSHLVESLLISAGFQKTDVQKDADIVIMNTCSVRRKAEERALGRIRSVPSNGKQPEIAVIGCMAQKMGDRLLNENKNVKYVLGTDRFHQLAELLKGGKDAPVVDISCRDEPLEVDYRKSSDGISNFVTIMRGCNNFCSYCIVPYVRGRERHREPDRILEEIAMYRHSGTKEIWLLGQNVNSYRFNSLEFPGLLERVADKCDIPRLRFLTSHPKDFSKRLAEVMALHKNICRAIHLPVQSGSDRILEKMNRKYTSDDYMKKVEVLRSLMPDVVISTDIIVGFPGETEEDYLRTREMMRAIEFDSAFMFRYSVREGTRAEKFEDDVPEQEKLERLDDLIRFQKEISERKMKEKVGSIQAVLLEATARQDENDAIGKSDGGINVVVRNAADDIGRIIKAKIISSTYSTLVGERID